MMNNIWAGLILISLITAVFTGQIDSVTTAAMEGAASAVQTAIMLLGVMCLWNGLMKIAENSGLTKLFSFLLRPITKILFPTIPLDSPANNAIVMNMTANMLGMSNAATPLGLKAMEELAKISDKARGVASNDMAMFAVINTASIQLIPATIISIRQASGGGNPFEIIVPIWVCSLIVVTVGVVLAKFFQHTERNLWKS